MQSILPTKENLKPFANLLAPAKSFYTIYRESWEDIGQNTLVMCYIKALKLQGNLGVVRTANAPEKLTTQQTHLEQLK